MTRLPSGPVILNLLLAIRIFNALNLRTFFQPDEYFQSLEPAWNLAFPSESRISSLTGAWTTWEWRAGLRSSLHPYLFAALYRLAAAIATFSGMGVGAKADLLIAAPKVLQAVFAAGCDWYTYRLAGVIYGQPEATKAALLLTTLSPWNWFCATRTLSNSLETMLTVAGLSYWPWEWFSPSSINTADKSKLHAALVLAATACLLRPTNVILWATLTLTMLHGHSNRARLQKLVTGVLSCGSAVLAVSVSTDRAFYGKWTFPPLQFLYFNLVQSLATFYGQNRADYYLTEGLPLLLTTALPFAGLGMWNALRQPTPIKRFALAMTVLVMTGALSMISHKEVRFLYPLLPVLHVLAAGPFAGFVIRSSSTSVPRLWRKARFALYTLLLALNLTIALYTTLVHQRGVLDVLHSIRHTHEAKLVADSGAKTTVAFLMPCHSTPWRSHLVHDSIEAWALTCEPPLDRPVGERAGYG